MHHPRYTTALIPADVGERVMVRYALSPDPDGPAGGPRLSDAVGDLLSWDHATLRIGTRSGLVDVPEQAMVAGKRVPPAMLRAASDVSVAEVQRMSALSWQALETERVGGWRLRAGNGFTGRANSVLPLGDPGLPLDRALARVEAWYVERGLRPRFQLPQPDTEALSMDLAARGWQLGDSADVMVGDVGAALEALGVPDDELPDVEITDVPSPAWLASYHYRGGALPQSGYAVLTHHTNAGFASIVVDGETVAIARAAIDGRWLGFSAVEVAEPERRRGLARHIMGGLLRWGRDGGARYAHLQVDLHNTAARSLYAGMGFGYHHRYDYRLLS